jgi:hypothetical protein
MTEPPGDARPPLPAPVPGPEQRDATVARLTEAFADGRIELEDLEQRLEIVMRATTLEDLKLTLTGLDTAAAPAAGGEPEVRVPAPPFRTDRPKASPRTIVVMSGTHRRGRWVPAPIHRVYAFMGGAKLDLRDAELLPGVTEIRLNVLMGGVSVIIPPDMDVEVDGWAFMGGIEERDVHPAPLETQVRRLRIYARVIAGGVEVKVRDRKTGPSDAAAMDQLDERRKRKKLREG